MREFGIVERRYEYGEFILDRIYVVRWRDYANMLSKMLALEFHDCVVWYDIAGNFVRIFCLIEDQKTISKYKRELYEMFEIGYVLRSVI